MLASFALIWYVTRVLTVDGNKDGVGAWTVVFTALYAVGTLAQFGGANLALKLAAVHPTSARRVARPGLILTLIFGVLGGTALAAVAAVRPAIAVGEHRWLVAAVAGAGVVALNLLVLSCAWLRGLGWIASGVALEMGMPPVCTIAVLVLIGRTRQVTIEHVLVVFAAALWISAVIAATISSSLLRRAADEVAPDSVIQYLVSRGSSLFSFTVTSLGLLLASYMPILVFGMTGDDVAGADYRSAFSLASFVALAPSIQAAYITPRLATAHAHGGAADVHALSWSATRNAFLLAVVVAIPLLVMPGRILTTVFGSEFASAAFELRVLALAFVIVVALGPVYPLMTTTGLEAHAGRIMIGVVLTATSLMLLVSHSTAGVTLASVVASVGFAVLGSIVLTRTRAIPSAVWQKPKRGP